MHQEMSTAISDRFGRIAAVRVPYNGDLRPENTALIVIDMQNGFLGKGGTSICSGYDISLTRICIEPIARVLGAARKAGLHVLHTRGRTRPDLADLPANKRWRSRKYGARDRR